jgi:hypothetical protein
LRQVFWFAALATCALPLRAAAAPDRLGHCTLPAGYYRVAPSAETVDLHLRSDPRLESQVIGNLQHSDIVFSDGSREIGDDVTWQRVKFPLGEGWARARSLWRTLPLTLDRSAVPVAGRCGDYDPLWSLSWHGRELRLWLFPGKFEMQAAGVLDGAKPGTALMNADAADASMTFIYTDGLCTDPQGNALGWGVANVIIRDGRGERLYSGCCETAPEAFVKR